MKTRKYLCFLPLWGYGINLIYEDDGRGILFSLFESLAQIALAFTSELGHYLWTVNEEEESSCLVGNSSGNQRLSCRYTMIVKIT